MRSHCLAKKGIFFNIFNKKGLIRNAKGIIAAFIVMIFLVMLSRLITVNASDTITDKSNKIKYYTSISIDKGDTLWSLEQTYNNGDDNVRDYINNIKMVNNMTSDTLYSGQNIIVYYYSDEIKQ